MRAARRRRAVRGAGVQDHDRPVRRHAHASSASTPARSKTGDAGLNSATGKKERIGRLLQMHANKREEIDEVYAGDIAAVVGLRDATTGDTLCATNAPILLEAMHFPEPVISIAIEPKTKADKEKLGQTRSTARRRGPDLPRAHRRGDRPDADLRHGRAAPRDHRRPHAARVRGRRPTSASRRSPTRRRSPRPVRAEGRFIKQTGGRGQYGDVVIEVEPRRAGHGLRVRERRSRAASIPREYIPAVREGLRGGGAERRARAAIRWSTSR